MNQIRSLGSIKELWRFPVKSMLGERLGSAHIDQTGLWGDRAYALLDVEQDRIVTAKNVKRFPTIFDFRASFAEEPAPGQPLPPVTIEMPDGEVVSSAASNCDEVLSARLGQEVKLVCVGERQSIPYHDASPLSVLTDCTLEQLRELQPQCDFDVRRFRMNLIIASDKTGFVENDWPGHVLRVGAEVQLQVSGPNARCVMTTLAQDELPADREIFSAMVTYNRLEMDNGRRYPCAGVYAQVRSPGVVGLGDQVST